VDITIEDLRTHARRRLPRAVFDYIDGGAEDEVTLARNHDAFEQIAFRPRALVDVSTIDRSTTILGQPISTPIILAPTGLSGMAAAKGELLAATAASRLGTIFTLSTMSATSIEEVAVKAPGPWWFQLYVWRDRGLTRSLMDRAADSGYRVMVLTVDVPVLGRRERDLRNGATIPPRITLRNASDTLRRWRWLADMARHPRVDFVNIRADDRPGSGPFLALGPFVNSQFDPSVTWRDLEWFRSVWSGPLALKGIMTSDDAALAVEHGVDAIVVSNHGGRQLDGSPATIEVLPEIVDVVQERAEVIFDGGIRRGSDIVKALALGARACMVGRAYLYGMAVAGTDGVQQAISILSDELERTLALLGRSSLAELDRTAVRSAR